MLRGCCRRTSAKCLGPTGPSGVGAVAEDATVTACPWSGGRSTQLARSSGIPLRCRAEATSAETVAAGGGEEKVAHHGSSVTDDFTLTPAEAASAFSAFANASARPGQSALSRSRRPITICT